MARGQLTYLNLVNRVLQRLGKPQVVTADFAGLASDSWGGLTKDAINDAQQDLYAEHDWSTLITSGTFTTSSRTYDLTTSFSNFGREIDLMDTTNNKPIVPVDQKDIDYEDPGQLNSGDPDRYAINYPDLLFNRTPTSVAYRLRYLIRPTALTTSTTTSLLPEQCDRVLILWVVWDFLTTREDDPTMGAMAGSKYRQALAQAKQQDVRRMDRYYAPRSAFPERQRAIVPFPAAYDREGNW